jgi:hypothetical protein
MKAFITFFLLPVCCLLFSSAYSQSWPIHIEAENYTSMSGIQTEPCGEGGLNVGYVTVGDWMDYSVTIPTAGIYGIRVRMAGPGGTIQIQNSSGTILSWVSFPATVSGQIYTTAYEDIALPAGTQTLRIYAYTALWNFNWFEIVQTNLILRNSFESTADFSNWNLEAARAGSLVISDSTRRKGLKSARFELTKSDSALDYFRSEIRRGSETNAERWYGFSNYLRSDWVEDVLAEVIAQWHEVPDWIRGENWRSPPISFGIQDDHYYVKVLWDADTVNTNQTKDGEVTYDLGEVGRAVWNDWVFHIRFDYDNDGILEVWKNGVKVLNRVNQPNSYNDINLPYFKIGVYKWGWDGWQSYSPENIRVIYYDEVRIGNENSNYSEVAPVHDTPASLMYSKR